MQDKHIIIVHHSESRDIFINKVKYPKTVYHVGNNPQPGDIQIDSSICLDRIYLRWIIDNYYNLPDYSIFMQANPNDHIVSPLTAIDINLKSEFGSFCVARAMYDQFSTWWVTILPLVEILEEAGIKLDNIYSSNKNIFLFYPGSMFFVSRKRLLEKPLSYYEKLYNLDEHFFMNAMKNFKKSKNFWSEYFHFHPEDLNKSHSEIFDKWLEYDKNRRWGTIGLCFEALWHFLLADKETLKLYNKSQAIIGNTFYFDTRKTKYSDNLSFQQFPISWNNQKSIYNYLLMENNWFDTSCPHFKLWQNKILEKWIYEIFKNGNESWEMFWERCGELDLENNLIYHGIRNIYKELGLNNYVFAPFLQPMIVDMIESLNPASN
jgi:hypothetical protein